MSPTRPAIAIDCHVRASRAVDGIDDAVATLRECHRRGLIDDLAVRPWPHEIVLGSADDFVRAARSADREELEQFESFRAWADRHGVSICPPFAIRQGTTLGGDGPRRVLVLPARCLAIHVDGQLASVVPHGTGTVRYTVADALADLRTGNSAWGPGVEPSVARSESTDSPDREDERHRPPSA